MPASPMTVVIDSREQKPWGFSSGIATVRKALQSGDYSVAGLESRIAIERKNLGDFVNTVVGQWLRFRKELNRLSGYDMACVVVEASIQDVLTKKYESDANPDSVLGRAHSIWLDHGIPVFWWGDRVTAIQQAEQMLRLAWTRWGGAA